jgi:hypothetical protein
MTLIHPWLGFENEDHEGGLPADYAAFVEQSELPPHEEREHGELVRRVAEEHGFTLSDWAPTIPSRSRT